MVVSDCFAVCLRFWLFCFARHATLTRLGLLGLVWLGVSGLALLDLALLACLALFRLADPWLGLLGLTSTACLCFAFVWPCLLGLMLFGVVWLEEE